MKTIRVGMLGLGTVGTGTYRILTGNSADISIKVGARLEVSRVLVRDTGKSRVVDIDPGIITDKPEDILDNSDIDIVVEVMGGVQPAAEYVLRAIKNGKSVVTANKDMIASLGGELLKAADKNGVDLLFEGSVGGGIPVIRALKYCLSANRIVEVMGIINGTTNYILTKMTREGADFAEVLKEAQDRGYAEADPTADIEGHDAARKLAILASISFNSRIALSDVYAEGISRISSEDIACASDLGYVVKLLGIAKNTDDEVEVRVHPCFVPQNHPLASVNDVFNAIYIRGDAVGETMLYGRGAGELPTGSAVASDVMAAARNKLRNVTGINCSCYKEKAVKAMGRIKSRYFLRIKAMDRPGVLASVAHALGSENVSIQSVIQKSEFDGVANIVLVTHTVLEENMQEALRKIKQLPTVADICNLIRVEG